MNQRVLMIAAALLLLSAPLAAQQRGQRGAAPPPTAKAMAPIDLTGYWTAVISEDWHTRMLTAVKNDMGSGTFPIQAGGRGAGQSNIPWNAEGRRVVAAWDPAKDDAEGNQCKAYGAAGIMRQPTRLHITWQDDNTLKVDTDYGTQTRLFRFAPQQAQQMDTPATTRPAAPAGEPTWQGNSAAEWQVFGGRGNWPKGGNLKVVTTNMKAGYYWKNGMPYSSNAVMTEHFRVHKEQDNSEWIVFSAEVNDPTYLNQPYVVTYHFKKLPNGNDWSPTPCGAK
jgi:hypothetical protein